MIDTNNGVSEKKEFLGTEELLLKINELSKDERFGRFQGSFGTIEELKVRGPHICYQAIKNDTSLELANLLLDHSLQAGFENGIDVNELLFNTSLFELCIQEGNYELFKKMIELGADYLGANNNTLLSTCLGPKSEKIEIHEKMAFDLLKLGANLDEDILTRMVMFMSADFIEKLSVTPEGSKVLTADFIELLKKESSVRSTIAHNPNMSTVLVRIHRRCKIAAIIENEGNDDAGAREALRQSKKKEITEAVLDPSFWAGIVDEVLAERGDEIDALLVELVKKRKIEDPKGLLEKLIK